MTVADVYWLLGLLALAVLAYALVHNYFMGH